MVLPFCFKIQLKDRKFFYSVYDFPSNSTGKKLKIKKKEITKMNLWNSKVSSEVNLKKKEFLF